MIASTFRAKLLLAMMVTVTVITAGTLLVTQHQVGKVYENFFQQQFLAEVAFYSQMQEVTMGTLKEQCQRFAGSVRVVAAMNTFLAESDERTRKDVYVIARMMLNEMAGSAIERKAALAILDNNGKVLQLSENQTGPDKGLSAQLQRLDLPLKMAASQEIGYLPLAPGVNSLHEVILTKLIDPENNQILGAVVVGMPVPAISRKAGTGLKTGLWLGDRIYETGLAEEDQGELGRQLSQNRGHEKHETLVYLKGQPFLSFKQGLNARGIFPEASQISLYSLAESLEEQRALRRLILSFGAAGLLAAIVLSLLLSRGLTAPIEDLVRGTREIEKGRYDVKVPIRASDEMGQLAASFNEMAEGLALKEKYRSVLNLVADKEIADDLLRGKIALGGEVRDITVLFCDIRGFTGITQNMDPRDVIQLLNEHFTPLTQVVYHHHGVVDKFVGDLIMALFGAPKSFGNDASNAVACALQMIQERVKLNSVSRQQISIGIGIASGNVIAGRMGSADRLNYSVLGERVNLASRLCGHAAPMEIIIDEATRERLSMDVPSQVLPDLLLKGFANRVTAHKLHFNTNG